MNCETTDLSRHSRFRLISCSFLEQHNPFSLYAFLGAGGNSALIAQELVGGGFVNEDGVLCNQSGAPVKNADGSPVIVGKTKERQPYQLCSRKNS